MTSNNPRSPRQRMINLMYLVFISMLALNVPTEVLDGFDLVEEGLEQTIKSTETQNKLITNSLDVINNQNPTKAGEWYLQANNFNQKADTLFNYIQDLKVRIVREADGKKGSLDNIKNKESLNAAPTVMLSKPNNEASKLKESIDKYRETSINLISNPTKKKTVDELLNTNVPKKGILENKSWEETFFDQMPTSAAITLLTKIQNDIRATQGEVLSELLNNIEGKDFRVNKIEAEVIPVSEFVTEGGVYEGRVVLTAVDTTKRPTFSIAAIQPDGSFKISAGGAGAIKTFEGKITLGNSTGDSTIVRTFKSTYHVVPRMVAIQPELTNVLYRGRDNKLTISVPGMSTEQLRISATNGSISRSGQSWIAKPLAANIMDISISDQNGRLIEKKTFRVRPVPDPMPYIDVTDENGTIKRFKGGRISKAALLAAGGIKAAIDDGILDEQFAVIQFSTTFYDSMGNGIRELSDVANFTEKQKSLIRQLPRGKTFYITDIKARVYGEERDISILEVRVY